MSSYMIPKNDSAGILVSEMASPYTLGMRLAHPRGFNKNDSPIQTKTGISDIKN